MSVIDGWPVLWTVLAFYFIPLSITLPLGIFSLRREYRERKAIADGDLAFVICLTWTPVLNIIGAGVCI